MNKANYITVNEFENWNTETDFSDFSSITLSGMISRASRWVDSYLNYSLSIEDITEKLETRITPDHDLVIFTRKIPIVSVSSLKLVLGTYSFGLSLEESDGTKRYDIPDPKHYILYPFWQLSGQGYLNVRKYLEMRYRTVFTEISYRAGYETIPDDIKDAVNLITKDIFNRQTNPMLLNSIVQGGITMSYGRSRGESDYIKEAKVILDRYKRVYL